MQGMSLTMADMPRTSHKIYDLSRSAPDTRQQVTAGSADFAVAWTAGLATAVASRPLFGAGSAGPLLVLLAASVIALALNTIVLAGRTGQSVGARVAQTADVSRRNGRPVGVVVMAQVLVAGGIARDPRLVKISLAGSGSRGATARTGS